MPHPYGLGLRQKIVRLEEPHPRWPEAFAVEANTLREALAGTALSIEHIGSTSIPNMIAKPIIDMMAGVRRLQDVKLCYDPLVQLGYDHAGEQVGGDHIFGKGKERTYLLHVVEMDGYRWRRNLAFRDRLREEPQLAQQYASLKQKLASLHPDNRAVYADEKMPFINSVVGEELSCRD